MCPFSVRVIYHSLEAFLGSLLQRLLYLHLCFPSASRLRISTVRIFLHCYYPACSSSSIRWILLAFSVTPSLIHQYRNLHLLSIDYAFRPRLRSRLTQSGRTFLWNPWVFGAWDSHPRFATHTGILSSNCSTFPYDNASPLLERSPTNYLRNSIASVLYLAPVYFRRRVIRLVSCYALFKGWLLLSQPPSCLYISTSFST